MDLFSCDKYCQFRKSLFKTLLLMNITTVFILAVCVSVSAKGFSQEVNINETNATLESVFNKINLQTGYTFVYTKSLLEKGKKVSVKSKGSLENILELCFKDQPITYTILNKMIIIKEKKTPFLKAPPVVKEVQVKPLEGVVTDESGAPLPGVSVVIKGSKIGVVTDKDGRYSLSLPDDAKIVLEFSSVGFHTQSITLSNKTELNVVLKMDAAGLEEVVVVGYGTQKKLSLTGAVSNIKGEDIMATKAPSLAVALAGKVPGLQIRQQSGMPGDFNTMVNVRGFGTPLFVIDGVVRDGDKEFQKINPEDIESISVLKDATAAIYGINSSNGAIIVTTKSGRKGPMEINYSGLIGVSAPTERTQMLNVAQYEEIRNEAEINAGRAPLYATPEELLQRSSLPMVDWYHEVFKKSTLQQQHNMTMQGGNEKLSAFTSIGYTTDNGLLKSGDIGYDKYSFRSNIKAQVAKNLTADVNLSGFVDKRYQPGTWDDAFFYLSKATFGVIPSETVYANNNPNYFNRPFPINDNPVAFSDKEYFGYREWRNKFFQSSLSLTYQVPGISGLKFKALGAFDAKVFTATKVQKSVETFSYSPDNGGTYTAHKNQVPSIQEENNIFGRMDLQGQLIYNKRFNNAHNLGAVMVMEAKQEDERYLGARRLYSFYTIDNIDRAAETGQTNGGWTQKKTYLSYIGRFNYDYKEKYLAEFAFRYDGSYRYAPAQRWGFFPVISLGWRMSEENFIKNNLSFVSNLKLRGSYGKTGQDAGNPFQFIPGFVSSSGYVFSNGQYTNGYSLSSLMNQNLTWFRATTTDVGIDLSLWDSKLDFSFDVYRRDRTGLLATRAESLPNTFGASLPQENLNSDRTEGIELMIGHRNQTGDFKYGGNLTMNFARSKTLYQERAPFRSSMDRYRNGQQNRWMDIGWGWDVTGQFQNFEEIRNAPIETEDRANSTTLPGDYIHKDVNGDGLINSNDRVPLFWSGQPKIHFGLSTFFSYKKLGLTMLWQGSGLNSMRYNEILGNVLAFDNSNSPAFFYDRWHLENPYDANSKWIPGYWPATRKNSYDAGSTRIESDANRISALYLRLKSVELSYNFSGPGLQSKGIKNLRVFANGYNLLVLCDDYLKQFDPEISDGNGFNYPISVSGSLGVNITF